MRACSSGIDGFGSLVGGRVVDEVDGVVLVGSFVRRWLVLQFDFVYVLLEQQFDVDVEWLSDTFFR